MFEVSLGYDGSYNSRDIVIVGRYFRSYGTGRFDCPGLARATVGFKMLWRNVEERLVLVRTKESELQNHNLSTYCLLLRIQY